MLVSIATCPNTQLTVNIFNDKIFPLTFSRIQTVVNLLICLVKVPAGCTGSHHINVDVFTSV